MSAPPSTADATQLPRSEPAVSGHFDGTLAPVEEPFTASLPD
jgi:hypothetical protein